MFWAFFAGANDAFASAPFYLWIYGPGFDLALLFVERSLGIEGARAAYLSRHLLMHLTFLTGGLFAYLLARRLSGNSLIGLFAMAIFLLHPRLYAHSFFNGKDIPFLALFAAALYLTHRAFRRDALLAFALLGAAVGALVSMRIMGVVLLAAIPALRALDFAFASGWAERKRVLVTAGAFVLAAGLAFFASLPHLWADPVGRAAAWWTTLSDHPYKPYELFRGLLGHGRDFREYVPVWFSITSPPFALFLGFVGAAAVLVGAVMAPRVAIRSGSLRFGLLLVGCAAAPVAAVALLDANAYNGWRHLYFLWAPFALLAALGLRRLATAFPQARLRAAVYGAAGAGAAATLASMALIHPNEHVYFNALVDRVTPERLRTQYQMDYYGHPMRQALERLVDNPHVLPEQSVVTAQFAHRMTMENLDILPDAARARIAEDISAVAIVPDQMGREWSRSNRVLGRVRVYGNTLFTIESKPDLQTVYESTRERKPAIDAAFAIHRMDDSLALVMEPCAPAFIENVNATLRATPADRGDLPPWREGKRYERRGFLFPEHGAFFNGKCVALLQMPAYPIADFMLVLRPEPLPREAARAAMHRAKDDGQLLARSAYDLYLADNELVYVQERCDPLETEHPFRVSVFSDIVDDSRRRRGWDREIHEFDFHERGALLEDGACVALFPLPDYSIAAIRTAQYVEGGDDVWSAAFSANPEPYRTAHRAVKGRDPLARGAFDLHLLDGDLMYVKEPCEQADTKAKFFLHVVPERVSDLPEERRQLGWDNLDFRFFLNGAWFDGKCAARVPLPDYPIASVRTGQFVVRAGEIWSEEFVLGEPAPAALRLHLF